MTETGEEKFEHLEAAKQNSIWLSIQFAAMDRSREQPIESTCSFETLG